jgi:hypothetical protein
VSEEEIRHVNRIQFPNGQPLSQIAYQSVKNGTAQGTPGRMSINIKQVFIVHMSLTTISTFYGSGLDMSFLFYGLSAVGMLAVVACLQGCANQSPVTSPVTPQKRESAPPATVTPLAQVSAPVESTSIQPLAPTLSPTPSAESVASAKPAATDRSAPGIAPVERRPSPELKPKAEPKPKPAPKPQPAPSKPVQPAEPLPVIPDPKSISVEPISSPEAVAPVEKEVEVTLETLPLNIHNEWILAVSGDICTLSTPPVRFDDGHGMSRLQLVFTPQHWLVKTQSDIDMSYSGTGLTVDEGRHFPLEKLVRDSDLMFTRDYAAMTQAFMDAHSLRITLGFWPSWPVTETKTITLSLQHFARAHRAWKLCQSLIHAR